MKAEKSKQLIQETLKLWMSLFNHGKIVIYKNNKCFCCGRGKKKPIETIYLGEDPFEIISPNAISLKPKFKFHTEEETIIVDLVGWDERIRISGIEFDVYGGGTIKFKMNESFNFLNG